MTRVMRNQRFLRKSSTGRPQLRSEHFECLAQVGDQVVRILDPQRQPDQVVIDKRAIFKSVRQLQPGGVERVLELVGTVTLSDSLKCVAPKGIVCMAGILGNEWTIERSMLLFIFPQVRAGF